MRKLGLIIISLILPTLVMGQGSAGGIRSSLGLGRIMQCVAASASGTAYTCTTNPSFTPVTNSPVLFKADVANTASANLAVNGSAAATIKKQGGGTNLVANDILIGQWNLLTFDGTNWQVIGQIGNVASGGVTSVGFTGGLISVGTPTTTPAFTVAGNSGGIPYFSGPAIWASSAAGIANAIVAWGGAGNAPTSPLSMLVTNQNAATETWTLFNSTATTGATILTLKAGAGQSSTKIFNINNNSGANQFNISSTDGAIASNGAAVFLGPVSGANFTSSSSNVSLYPETAINDTGTAFAVLLASSGAARQSMASSFCAATSTFPVTVCAGQLTSAGHLILKGIAPTIASGFGTSPSIAGGDGAMRITVGGGGIATTGVVNFGTAWATAPACTANDESAILLVQAIAATSSVTITSATPWGAGALITVRCGGY